MPRVSSGTPTAMPMLAAVSGKQGKRGPGSPFSRSQPADSGLISGRASAQTHEDIDTNLPNATGSNPVLRGSMNMEDIAVMNVHETAAGAATPSRGAGLRFAHASGSRPLDGYTIKRGVGRGG